LQNDQITIAEYEVELNDLRGAANYANGLYSGAD
jgi:hypothetical protein